MTGSRFFAACMVVATVATGAIGLINIMKLRLRADDVGVHIVRIERSIQESKKELDALKRQRDFAQDTVQLIQRVGDDLKPPVPEQVAWLRITPGISAANTKNKIVVSPRMTAMDIAFQPLADQGGTRTR
jgi:hypothetical protein